MVEKQESSSLKGILEDGERVFWRASPEKEAFIQPNWVLRALGWVICLLSMGFLLAGVAAILKGRPSEAIIFFLMFIPWAIAAFYLGYGRDYICSRMAKNSQYILTDRRLIIRSRFFHIKYIIAQLADIKAVETKEVESKQGGSVGEVIIRVGSPGLRVTRTGSALKTFNGQRSTVNLPKPRGRSDDLILFGVRNPQEIASILQAGSKVAREPLGQYEPPV